MPRVEGRSTVYNEITSEEKMKLVNSDNLELEKDFLEYLEATDKAKNTIRQYTSNLHIIWCWSLEFNKNKAFVDFTKREITKFQNHALNVWGWSPRRMRTVKATARSLENYIENMLDDEFPDYRAIWNKIESPVNEEVRTKTIFNDKELKSLLDRLVEENQYMKACVLALAMYSGKRKAELTRFKVSYFDDKNLICGGALYKTPEKMVTKGRGQRGKLLDVYVLAKPFRPYFDLWMQERERLGIDSEWLFPDSRDANEHIGISMMNSLAETFSRMMGKAFYFHSVRHFWTTSMLEANLPEAVVQMISGWSSAEMLRLYDDRSNDSQLEKYFGADGIKSVKQSSLEDL